MSCDYTVTISKHQNLMSIAWTPELVTVSTTLQFISEPLARDESHEVHYFCSKLYTPFLESHLAQGPCTDSSALIIKLKKKKRNPSRAT